jgi:hypothetical protein
MTVSQVSPLEFFGVKEVNEESKVGDTQASYGMTNVKSNGEFLYFNSVLRKFKSLRFSLSTVDEMFVG